MSLRIYYRISDKGNRAGKPDYINWQNCLANFAHIFGTDALSIITDNVEAETSQFIAQQYPGCIKANTQLGNAKGFEFTLDLALKEGQPEDLIYFVEDDYIHRQGAAEVLQEGLAISDYVSLYDHLDKYMDPSPNPFVKEGAEVSKVFLTASTHWKTTNSTCMTFATRHRVLAEDQAIFRKHCQDYPIPADFGIFMDLYLKKRRLICPIPGYATHGMSNGLSPLVDWQSIASP